MLYDNLLDRIKDSLPDFYKEHMPDDSFFIHLYQVYLDAMTMVADMVLEIGNNSIITKTEIFRRIPFHVLVATTGLYDIILLKNKYQDWDSKTLKQKVDILDKEGYYELINTRREWDKTDLSIAALDIDRSYSGEIDFPYTAISDYIVVGNKLYLFGDLAKPPTDKNISEKKIILKDIKLDHGKIWKKWGTMLQFTHDMGTARFDYRKTLTGLLRAYIGGPTIANIKAALRELNSEIEIVDKVSARGVLKSYWETGNLEQFDFIVVLPNALLTDTRQKDYIKLVLSTIKPAYTKYILLFSSGSSVSYDVNLRYDETTYYETETSSYVGE